MRRLLLDVSPTGVQHHVHVGHDGDEIVLEEYTPTAVETEVLDTCARLRSLHQRPGRHFQHAARIPVGLYATWKKEWREHWKDVYTWPTFEVIKLNNRDFGNLRTGFKRGGSKRL